MPVQFPTLKCAPSTIVSKLASGPLADQTPVAVRSLMFDGVAITPATVAGGDLVLIQDLDDSLNLKAVTAQSIADLASSLGDVIGPAGATDNALVRYDTATGKLIQNSLVLVDDAGNMTGVNNITPGGTVDGRDVAADGLVLDGIEPGADITDEGNVVPALDGATLTAVTLNALDKVLIQDISDGDNLKTVTAQSIADLAGAAAGISPNLLLNGNFDIAQRGASLVSPVDGDLTLDRWAWYTAGAGVVTITQDTDVPDGFSGSSISVDVTTADAAIGAGDRYHLSQRIEGLNAIPMALGTSDATSLTLTFWVKSPLTGIHCVYLQNGASNRSYPSEYTVSVADTWEFKTVTLSGDTAGTWLIDTGIGLEVGWCLAAGINFHGTNDTWNAADDIATVNQVNCMDNAANFFKLAQAKLEVGAAATAFTPRLFANEFKECERYYRAISEAIGVCTSATLADIGISHTGMRAAPTVITPATVEITDVTTNDYLQSSVSVSSISNDANGGRYRMGNFTGMVTGNFCMLTQNNGDMRLDAEL